MRKSVSRSLRVNTAAWSIGPRRPFRPATLSFASTADTSPKTQNGKRPFWTAGRALLLSAFASSIAYAFGAAEAGNHFERPQPSDSGVPVYGTTKDLERAVEELRGILGEDTISTDDEDLRSHGYSEWSSINIDQLPVAVAYPKSTEEVSQIARVCSKYRMPMIPYSGGSSLEANFSAPFGGMSIDFAYMSEILAVHEEDMDVVVQPSVGWMDLNNALQKTGLFFPVDPGPSAMIGGMVGTSSSGTNAMRYGTMREWVLSLTIVLADGRVIKTRKRPRKSSAGYNLNGIFVGSEGTLGIVTEITLKLAVIPQETKVGVATFPTMRDAASAAMQLIRSGVQLGAMEIMDDVQMNVINRAGATPFRKWDEVPTLFFKFSGTKAGVEDSLKLTTQIAKSNKSKDFIFAKTDKEAHDLWTARKESLWSMLSLRKEGDEKSKVELDGLGLFASVLGHIGDGNFHTSILYNRTDPAEREKVERMVHNMVETALEMEGTCTGEHGIGLGKKKSLVKELGIDTIGVMQQIKRSLDPHWLMNPGKIFDGVPPQSTKSRPKATAASTLERP